MINVTFIFPLSIIKMTQLFISQGFIKYTNEQVSLHYQRNLFLTFDTDNVTDKINVNKKSNLHVLFKKVLLQEEVRYF